MLEKKILVVDDEEIIRELLQDTFGKDGYIVRTAESSEAALAILNDEKIQVMFLDLSLPGMNGMELCKIVRKDFPIAIIYAVTGYASLFELADCREVGFDDYFTKPINIKLLQKAAQEAFDKLERWKKK